MGKDSPQHAIMHEKLLCYLYSINILHDKINKYNQTCVFSDLFLIVLADMFQVPNLLKYIAINFHNNAWGIIYSI